MAVKALQSVRLRKPKRNVFDLTHDVKLSCKMGELVPVLQQECLPGDTYHIGADSLIRLAPILAPIMHRIDVSIHYFFVPNRLVWPNWENFITNTEATPGVAHVFPYLPVVDGFGAANKRFLDYMDIPPLEPGDGALHVNALPLAAYQLIYNEYYRDQNLIAEVDYELVDGDNNASAAALSTMRQRAWTKDYFTAALPWAQKGSAVSIPLGDVILKDDWDTFGTPRFANPDLTVGDSGPLAQNIGEIITTTTPSGALAYDPQGTLEVGATTINTLRQAFRLQEWLERSALGGSRYTESIRAHFGVTSPDARLQRPEYITGVKTPIIISEILNNSGPSLFFNGDTGEPEQTGSPQGDMAGHGVAVTSGKFGKYYCYEHGYIIGIMSILPFPAYQQGLPKHLYKQDFLDFYFPEFAHLGEQEVKQREIYVHGNFAAQDTLFGYVPRYMEYRYKPNRVAGDFRTTLNYWHLGRIFSAAPTLSQEFIECTDDQVNRIFADQDGTDNLWCQVVNKIKAIRPIPVFGTPSGV